MRSSNRRGDDNGATRLRGESTARKSCIHENNDIGTQKMNDIHIMKKTTLNPLRHQRSHSPPRSCQETLSGGAGNNAVVQGRCPPLNLEWLIELTEKKKKKSALDRNSLLAENETHTLMNRSVIEQSQIIDTLKSQGFTTGLAQTLIQNTDRHPVRIWLVDNSGTMNSNDGHLVVSMNDMDNRSRSIGSRHSTTSSSITLNDCTRWEELSTSLLWHANFNALMGAPMAIRLVNDPGASVGPQQLGVAASEKRGPDEELKRLRNLLQKSRPDGSMPLTIHLHDVIQSIVQLVPRLQHQHRLHVEEDDADTAITIVIVTDKILTDCEGVEGDDVNQEFLNTLLELEGLPVRVVIRLCTDEARVIQFYNHLDARLGDPHTNGGKRGHSVHVDVLDDFKNEAREVYRQNPWLNYGLPLHLSRESGFKHVSFDVLDNRPLTHNELTQFVALLFDLRTTPSEHESGPQMIGEFFLPNAATDYQNFRLAVLNRIKNEAKLYNPIKHRMMPWIDMKEMDRIYGVTATDTPCSCIIL